MVGPQLPEVWLDHEIEKIMGPDGADYSAEPVAIYGMLSRLIKEMRREREMLYALLEYREAILTERERILQKLREASTKDELRAVWIEEQDKILALDEPAKTHVINLKDYRKKDFDDE